MLAEVLHRVGAVFAGAVGRGWLTAFCAVLLLAGCSGRSSESSEKESSVKTVTAAEVGADSEVSSSEDISSQEDDSSEGVGEDIARAFDEESSAEDSEKTAVEIEKANIDNARAAVELWLGYLETGDTEKAEELMSSSLIQRGWDKLLFNADYPQKAQIDFIDLGTKTEEIAGATDVTLRLRVTPENDSDNYADAIISVRYENGKPVIYDIKENGSEVMRRRQVLLDAKQAYEKAVEILERTDEDSLPESRMHHKGEGGDFMNELEYELRDRKGDDFSIAIIDGEVLYAAWSDGEISEKFPDSRF